MTGFKVREISCMFAIVALTIVAWGCTGAEQSTPETGNGQSATMAEQAEGEGIPALSGAEEEARVEADEWREDAELYAIAAATPRLDADGRSPSWLYTYVSESAGAVMSVTVSADGAEAAPEQKLPEPDIRFILKNTLPDPSEMIDSTEAMQRSENVRPVLEEDPNAQASAGLDTFSGGEAQWILATTRGEERIEERVPAVAGE